MRLQGLPRRASTTALIVGFVASVVVTPAAGANATRAERSAAPASPPEGSVPDLAAMGWVPIFDDEFDGEGVDETVWSLTTGPGLSGPGMNTRDAVRVVADPGDPGDGVLEILTYSEDTDGDGALEHYTGELQTGSLNGPQVGAGFAATYGYIEARAKVHAAPDVRSAFWMLSAYSQHDAPFNDPAAAAPEIDIFEIQDPASGNDPATGNCRWVPVEAPCDRIVDGGKHWDGFDEDHKSDRDYLVLPTGTSTIDSFHTWGLLWTPAGYRMYFDGTQYYESTEAITYSPEHLILSQHQGDRLAGTVPVGGYGDLGDGSNARTTVDYVRVWQRPVSEVPDRTVPANTSLSAPFWVTDSFYASPAHTEPGSVRVAARSGNTHLVPDENIVVTGNPTNPDGTTAAPGGSFENGGFESPLAGSTPPGWRTTAGTATTWSGRTLSGSRSLRLEESGGRVEQTITGLQPNTAYAIGGYYNLELDWQDDNGNGRIDWVDIDGDGACEGSDGEVLNDPDAAFDWGVVDVDASLPGNQEVKGTHSRNGSTERCQPWSAGEEDWLHRTLGFTTGPDTTEITLYIANDAYAGSGNDSNLSVDDVYLRPIVPPDRTVTVRPVTNRTGAAAITLTAWVDGDRDGEVDIGEQVLGTEEFTVTFTAGSTFTNGDFEAMPAGSGWELGQGAPGRGADVIVDDPFSLDRVLELAGPGAEPDAAERSIGTVWQRMSSLKPGSDYTVEVTGRGDLAFAVQNHGGSQVTGTIATPDWSTESITFTTGATNTTADLVILDWDTSDGPSLVDDVAVIPATSAGASLAPVVSPQIIDLGEQRISSSAPAAADFSLPKADPATRITGVTSSNPSLLPPRAIGVSTRGKDRVLSLTPTPGRSGKATVTVAYDVSGVAQPPKEIPVVVSDGHLRNPGFEQGRAGWTGGSTATDGQRSGRGALVLPDSGAAVSQTLTGLPYNVSYVLEGWSNGTVTATVRTVPDVHDDYDQAVEVTEDWTGAGWTAHGVRFTTTHCTSCGATGTLKRDSDTGPYKSDGAKVQVSLRDAAPGDGQSVLVDDLGLLTAPTIRPFRDFSVHQHQTGFDSNGSHSRGTTFSIGNIPANAPWNPAVTQISSSDTTVLPLDNIELTRNDPAQPYRWRLRVKAGGATQTTGRSDVTVTLTDPATGFATSHTVSVTVNAGNNMNNGDFQRTGAGLGWFDAWVNTSWEIRNRQDWHYLRFRCATPPPPEPADWAPCDPGVETVGPDDHDQVLRISSGVVGYKVTGLTGSTDYVLRGNAIGSGSTVRVVATNGAWGGTPVPIFGTERARVTIDSRTWAPMADLHFSTEPGETEVYIFVWDDSGDITGDGTANSADRVPPSDRPCALYAGGDYYIDPGSGIGAGGETCVDDLGLFRFDG